MAQENQTVDTNEQVEIRKYKLAAVKEWGKEAFESTKI